MESITIRNAKQGGGCQPCLQLDHNLSLGISTKDHGHFHYLER